VKTIADAVMALVAEANRSRISVAGYKRTMRALKVLQFTETDNVRFLATLEYADDSGQLRPWLIEKLNKETK
jgi:hypothetical protein